MDITGLTAIKYIVGTDGLKEELDTRLALLKCIYDDDFYMKNIIKSFIEINAAAAEHASVIGTKNVLAHIGPKGREELGISAEYLFNVFLYSLH